MRANGSADLVVYSAQLQVLGKHWLKAGAEPDGESNGHKAEHSTAECFADQMRGIDCVNARFGGVAQILNVTGAAVDLFGDFFGAFA